MDKKILEGFFLDRDSPEHYELAKKIVERLYPEKELIEERPSSLSLNYNKKFYKLRGKEGSLTMEISKQWCDCGCEQDYYKEKISLSIATLLEYTKEKSRRDEGGKLYQKGELDFYEIKEVNPKFFKLVPNSAEEFLKINSE